ncbi:MAG: hypothetical protein Q9221_006414 [Calogaya cf. arnoldii]
MAMPPKHENGAPIAPTPAGNASCTEQPQPPNPTEPTTIETLKSRIRHHYEHASEYYYSLWGEHIHHGYFLLPTDTKELAQRQLIDLLLQRSKLVKGSSVLDVGCGIGGTSRYLASTHDCHVTGITISGKQVEMATNLTAKASNNTSSPIAAGETITLAQGTVSFLELDAEKMGAYFTNQNNFDCIWISEALSHLPDKALFFSNAFKLLKPGGKLVVADWFRGEGLTEKEVGDDIKPIEGL